MRNDTHTATPSTDNYAVRLVPLNPGRTIGFRVVVPSAGVVSHKDDAFPIWSPGGRVVVTTGKDPPVTTARVHDLEAGQVEEGDKRVVSIDPEKACEHKPITAR
jgi:hypothetical protein